MEPSARILLVEDDPSLRGQLALALREADFEVEEARSAHAAFLALARSFDLLVLDLGLPDGDGLDLCRDLRRQGRTTPILILSARDEPHQRVRGLDLGADDYVSKPFHLPELLARIRSLLRRTGSGPDAGRVACGELWAEAGTRTAGRGARELALKPREFELLIFLLRHPDRAWTRAQLLERVWGRDFEGDARTVDLHVRRLRVALEVDPSSPRWIRTVWGTGYRLSEDRESAR